MRQGGEHKPEESQDHQSVVLCREIKGGNGPSDCAAWLLLCLSFWKAEVLLREWTHSSVAGLGLRSVSPLHTLLFWAPWEVS